MSRRRSPLYLIDGSSYVYRAFFALPPLTAPSGMPTNAAYGFTTMLLKLLGEARPEYAAVVFDAPGPTFRDELYAEYKANRAATPDDLTAQLPLVNEIIAAMNLQVLRVAGVEADDVIATLTEQLAKEDFDCIVVTGDKDLMQIVGPHVTLWDTMRDRKIDSAGVEARLGVAPSQVVDVLALMGDSVDNIPGVKGIGEKTAVTLIRHFGRLEAVLTHLEDVERMELRGAKRIAERLRDGAATARLSRRLATIRRDVPLDYEVDDFRVRPSDTARLRTLFTQLGFQSLARQLSGIETPVTAVAERVAGPDRIARLVERAREEGRLALVSVHAPDRAATRATRELVLCAGDDRPVQIALERPDLRGALRSALGDPPFAILCHDYKRELLGLLAHGVEIGGAGFDLMIASYLLEATATHGMPELAAEILNARLDGFREDEARAAAAATVMGRLADEMTTRLRAADLEHLFRDVEMPLARVLAGMERRGMGLDQAYLRELGAEFGQRLQSLMAEIYGLAGGEFNINSPPQLRTILFDRLGLSKKGVKRGKTGYSTDVDVLNRLARNHPLPAKILEYRALAKLQSTYVDALLEAVDPDTGRLHTTFNQTVAATGRLSSSDPNLQNIPIRGEEGRRIRRAFRAAPGHLLLAADYSQIELRVLAHLSGDPALVDAFATGQDIHARTAREVFAVPPEGVTSDMRRVAKVINFGVLYGMGPQRLANELGIPLAEAQAYIKSYFTRHAGVRAYMDRVVREGRVHGFVTTLLGRRRAVPELRSRERGASQAAERVAANTPIQGSAADIIKLAMVAADRRLAAERLDAHLLLQVHDELLLEVTEAHHEAAREVLREEMEAAFPLAVPLRVDVGSGRTWADAH